MSKKYSRRQFIKASTIGIAVTGSIIAVSRILPYSTRRESPNPYPVLPDKITVIPSPEEKPLFFNDHQYHLVAVIAALIVPTDDSPGATEAGVANYIDRRASESERKQQQYAKGLDWIDRASQRQFGNIFLNLTVKEQIELLVSVDEAESKIYDHGSGLIDRINRKADIIWNDVFGLSDSAGFFQLIRKDVFYGYYSNPITWKVVGYYGPPQPVGYLDFSEPPSSSNYIATIRQLSDNTCRNCHFNQKEKVDHQGQNNCLDCHEPHFPFEGRL